MWYCYIKELHQDAPCIDIWCNIMWECYIEGGHPCEVTRWFIWMTWGRPSAPPPPRCRGQLRHSGPFWSILVHSGPFPPRLRLFDVRMLRNGSGESGEGGEGRGEDNDQVEITKEFTLKIYFSYLLSNGFFSLSRNRLNKIMSPWHGRVRPIMASRAV